MPRILRSLIAASVITAGILFAAWIVHVAAFSAPPGLAPFTIDTFLYQSAFEVLAQGGNPYDYQALVRQEALRSVYQTGPVCNTPLSFAILWPLLSLGFSSAVYLLSSLNFVLAITLSWLSLRILNLEEPERIPILIPTSAALLYAPVIDCIKYGQISLIAVLGVYAFVHLCNRRWDYLAGCFLVLALIKPQISYLFLIASGIWILTNKRWRIIAGAIGTAAIVNLPLLLNRPSIYSDWLAADGSISKWKAVSAVTPIRLLFADPEVPSWPGIVVPLLSVAGTLWWLASKRKEPWKLSDVLVPLLSLSTFTTPYIWVFDYSVLLCIPCMVACVAYQQQRLTRPLAMLIALHLALILLHGLNIMDWRIFWIFPLYYFVYHLQVECRRNRPLAEGPVDHPW